MPKTHQRVEHIEALLVCACRVCHSSKGLTQFKYLISQAQHQAAQRVIAQHSMSQHSTAQHSTAQHSTAQHSTAI